MYTFLTNWSHKNAYLCALFTLLLDHFYTPYCKFHRSYKEKCPLWAKTQVQYVNPGTFLLLCFYYVASWMYCGGSEF